MCQKVEGFSICPVLTDGVHNALQISVSTTGTYPDHLYRELKTSREVAAPVKVTSDQEFPIYSPELSLHLRQDSQGENQQKLTLAQLAKELGVPLGAQTARIIDAIIPLPASESPYAAKAQLKFWLNAQAIDGPAMVYVLKEGEPLESSFIIHGGNSNIDVCETKKNGGSTLWEAVTQQIMKTDEEYEHQYHTGGWQVVIIPMKIEADGANYQSKLNLPSPVNYDKVISEAQALYDEEKERKIKINSRLKFPPVSWEGVQRNVGLIMQTLEARNRRGINDLTHTKLMSSVPPSLEVGIRDTQTRGANYGKFEGVLLPDKERKPLILRIKCIGVTKDNKDQAVIYLNSI